jgi:hypothetical protein
MPVEPKGPDSGNLHTPPIGSKTAGLGYLASIRALDYSLRGS